MTALPNLDDRNVNYVLETAENILENTDDRRAGSKGEEQARHLFLNELMKYCDETSEQNFTTHPGAGTLTQKLLCALLIICVVFFSVSVNKGFIAPVIISLILNLVVFCVFVYKFIFDGTKFDFIKPKKRSGNILGKRYSRGETGMRVVLTANIDAPQSLRGFIFGNRAPFILSVCAIVGNTVLFCCQLFYLFAGAPANSDLFNFFRGLCLIFLPFYIVSLFLVNPKVSASGVSSSLIPSSVILSVMKQLFEDGFRYEKTEVCCLLTGSGYSSKVGSYAFAKKYRRLFSDVRTVFIPIEEITTSEKLAVFFRDGSGTNGSAEVASVIAQAADNLQLKLSKESSLLGTASFSPFSAEHFAACSLGTSKKHISKSVSPTADKLTAVRRKTIGDVGALIIETINYYDS